MTIHLSSARAASCHLCNQFPGNFTMGARQQDCKWAFSAHPVWRVDFEKPVRTGHKQGEMKLNCFSL
jgi:hypothetical protein